MDFEIFSIDEIAQGLHVDTLVINMIDLGRDAGEICGAVHSICQTLSSQEIGEANSDMLYDYRADLPTLQVVDGAIAGISIPRMNLTLATDVNGVPFLYLAGHEPHFKWMQVAQEFLRIIALFGVQRVFTVACIPAAVPHTRPVDMVIRSTKPNPQAPLFEGEIVHPAGVCDFFELLAQKAGIDVTNIRVRVPMYFNTASNVYFAGALAGIRMLAQLGGPTLPVGDMERLELLQRDALEEQTAGASAFQEFVHHLEREYDERGEQFARNDEITCEVPSAEEIGQAAELFLATYDKDPLEHIADIDAENIGSVAKPDDVSDELVENLSEATNSGKSAHDLAGERRRDGVRLRRGRHHYIAEDGSNTQSEEQ
ncbi:PAC2 family protein [Trueperella sp. LYQ143]|uniref:PAC2 family protein n=1 Tax=unclassified Trueperella TaxID=2630174 RepID=UPI00398380D6